MTDPITEVKEAMFKGQKTLEAALEYQYNTPDERMIEMTILSSREAWALPTMLAMHESKEFIASVARYNNGEIDTKPKMFFLINRWALLYMKAKRSTQSGKNLNYLSEMAKDAIAASAGAEEEFMEPIESV